MAGPPPVVARARTAVRRALTDRLEELADDTAAGQLSPHLLVGLSGEPTPSRCWPPPPGSAPGWG